MDKRLLLLILDGWGEGEKLPANAIYMQGAPNFEKLRGSWPNTLLSASGEDVGLPEGQMGNSEVGHLNIGAGRVVYQDLVKINRECRAGRLYENGAIKEAFDYVKESGKKLHFIGLVSDGGVHSSFEHLIAFLDLARELDVEEYFVHAFTDGRDTDPKSGKGFIEQLEKHLEGSNGKLASIIGRYYAMDRDKRWERIEMAYNLLVKGEGEPFVSGVEAMERSYQEGVTDEFVTAKVAYSATSKVHNCDGKVVDNYEEKPVHDCEGRPVATIAEGDAVIFFNFRNDRARELTTVLTQMGHSIPNMEPLKLHFSTLTPYDDTFVGLNILFEKENVEETIGEVISKAGLKQLRIAETEKYGHVTFFFSGGREVPFKGEERILINSPKVTTYDLKPEMSAPEVTSAVIEQLERKEHHFVVLNYANCDMVGHTGVFDAIKEAVRVVDEALGKVVESALTNGYSILITADHGNADNAKNRDGSPNTAHSLNPVPLVVIDPDVERVESGILADIAPTILKLMGLGIPQKMSGTPLI